MLNLKFIRNNAQAVQENARNKGVEVDVAAFLELDDQRRNLQQQLDDLRAKRNDNSAEIKKLGKPTPELIEAGKQIKDDLAKIEAEFNQLDEQHLTIHKQIPNMASDDVPVGLSEDENQVAKTVGEPTAFDFKPLNHYEIADKRDWIDKERAAKVTGARFAYIKGDLVKLQMVIVNFVIDRLTDEAVIKKLVDENNLKVSTKPFVPVLPPLMIRTEPYDQMDRLRPSEDRYKIEGEDLWLQGSAEHVLGSMHANETFEEADLPIRYLGYATSFRREAGTYGKDMEGILRMHQFDKLELESFSTKETSFDEHLLFVAIQEYLLSELDIPYRVIQKCTIDIGKPNARGIDIEAWLPGQNRYRETHTADYMTDYQARRLQTRVRRINGDLELIHTNDATAFAVGRLLIAIIENNQTEDYKVKIPAKLQPFMGGKEEI